MATLPNPNQDKPFEHFYTTTKNGQEEAEYGERTVDGHKELVHLPSGRSNMTYYKPEVVFDASNCSHDFKLTDPGTREVECRKCSLVTNFHVVRNYIERSGCGFVVLQGKEYPITER